MPNDNPTDAFTHILNQLLDDYAPHAQHVEELDEAGVSRERIRGARIDMDDLAEQIAYELLKMRD